MSGNPAEERAVITFQAAAKASKWFENRRRSAEQPPPILHHFTDSSGLFGILDTHTLRASLATTLNDCSEVEYGVNLAKTVLSQLRSGSPSARARVATRLTVPQPHARK